MSGTEVFVRWSMALVSSIVSPHGIRCVCVCVCVRMCMHTHTQTYMSYMTFYANITVLMTLEIVSYVVFQKKMRKKKPLGVL